MTAEPREELLSAYLDDELSADERARVEQWLDESAEYRQLYEELRGVRNDLQALPRHTLADDLGPMVLRRAERAVLSGTEHASGADRVESESSAPWWLFGRSRRTFIWPVVALAAALMVALFDARRDEQRDVAMDAPAALQDADKNEALADEDRAGRGAGVRDANEGDTYDSDGGKSDFHAQPAASEVVPLGREAGTPRLEKSAEAVELNAKEAAPVNREMRRSRSLAADAPAPAASEVLRGLSDDRLDWKSIDALKMDTNVRRALKNREQVNLIQCDVPPNYISENQLEKVLAGKKVTFQRFAVPIAADKKNADEKDVSALVQSKVQQPGVQYTVQATPEQVEQIVTELEQEQGRKRVSNLTLGLQVQNVAAKPLSQKPDAASDAASLFYLKQQPVMIYLRQIQAAQPAVPADP